jgi:myo-inositol 2-dehydrogenase/D-chiro-inositol 1-dehydrogenase
MRVAVIGTGSMGGMHARLLAAMPDVDQLLVVDADPSRAITVASATDARTATEDEALSAVDALVVATPAGLHDRTVRAAIAAGLPVLCEKPLTEDLASSRELAELAERSGAHVEIGFQRRHDPGFARARAAVASGSAGAIQLLRLTALDPRGPERDAADWPAGELAPMFLHSSVHDFDFVRWMTGAEVVEVTADGSRRDGTRPEDPRGLETAVVTMRTDGGALAVLGASWLHPGGYDVRAELLADRLHVTMGLSPRTPAGHEDWPHDAADGWTGYLERFEPAYAAELGAFLAAVRGGQPPATTARDGVEALRIGVAATRAYLERRTVSLDEI